MIELPNTIEHSCDEYMALLKKRPKGPFYYFRPKEEDSSWLGLGVLKSYEKPEDIDELSKNFAAPFFFAHNWDGDPSWPRFMAVIPKWLFLNSKEHGQRLYEFSLNGKHIPLENFFYSHNCSATTYFEGQQTPSESDWNQQVNTIIESIKKENVEKVVLARKASFVPTNNTEKQHFPLSWPLPYDKSSYTLSFSSPENIDNRFISFSPERLFLLRGQEIYLDALAGTAPRGTTDKKDKSLEQQLLNNPKEIHEHQLVIKGIKQELQPFIDRWSEEGPLPMKRQTVQHIHTKITATIKKRPSLIDLCKGLHPTPAVGGLPKEKACEMIKGLESWSRGAYASALGICSPERIELAVGLRSALVTKTGLELFAGAGIVKDSLGPQEWKETELKMQAFCKHLNVVVD